MWRAGLVLCALLCASAWGAGCAPGCACTEESRTVSCASAGLHRVPTHIPENTASLVITGNRINRVERGSFSRGENITELELSDNGITELGSHAFSLLLMLNSLDLSRNQLALIHPEAFWVSGSPLKALNLSGSLYNSTSVTDLITALRWGSLANLQLLDLSANCLGLLPLATFSPLPSLRRLILANNSLVAFYSGTFSGPRQLEELDLRANAFQTISTEGLRELGRLSGAKLLLGHNPYACSCEVQEFAWWLNGSRVQVADADALLCASPPELWGVSLRALGARSFDCYGKRVGEGVSETGVTLQTSYVFLGLVLGFVGMVFLLVLYLNRQGIEKWVTDMHAACRDVLEGYHYRYEIDSDPRLGHLSGSHPQRRHPETRATLASADACANHIPSDVTL